MGDIMIIDGMEIIGVNDKFPDDLKYFKEELIWTSIDKSNENPDIDKIVSVSVNTNVISCKIVNINDDVCSDKNNTYDKTLGIEVSFYFRVKYTTNSLQQYIYTTNSEMTKIFYVSMPNTIDDIYTDELVRHKKINITPYIADIYAREKDSNSIYLRILFYLAATVKNKF